MLRNILKSYNLKKHIALPSLKKIQEQNDAITTYQ